MKAKLFGSIALLASSCMAADLPPASRAEIDALLNRLGDSGCQFNRNGTWYKPAEARAHLARKLDYLLEKKQVQGSEQFIDVAASASSISGKNYLVKCGTEPAVPSAQWLKGQLQQMRSRPVLPAGK